MLCLELCEGEKFKTGIPPSLGVGLKMAEAVPQQEMEIGITRLICFMIHLIMRALRASIGLTTLMPLRERGMQHWEQATFVRALWSEPDRMKFLIMKTIFFTPA